MARSNSTESVKDAARASDDALSACIQRLANKLTGQNDFLGLTGKVGETVLTNAAAQGMRKYPLATVLVGAGLAYMAWGRKDSAAEVAEDVEEEAHSMLEVWRARADDAREVASERLSALYSQVSGAGQEAAAFAREKAAITADLAQDLADAFNDGLEGMTEDAAARVSDARERAYSAVSSGIKQAKGALGIEEEPEDVPGLIRRHPVASVAVAVAVGAAITAAVQANKRSDGALAASVSDTASSLMNRARDVVEQEGSRAGHKIAETASSLKSTSGDTAMTILRELASMYESMRNRGSALRDDAEDFAEETVEQVKDTGKKVGTKARAAMEAAEEEVETQVKTARKAVKKAVKPRKEAAEEMIATLQKKRR